MVLVKWNYSKEEWGHFQQWQKRKKGLWASLYLKCSNFFVKSPEIGIASDRVWINKEHRPFCNSNRCFRDIYIIETGKINVLKIYYEQHNRVFTIPVPIPKGKLREAFAVQEKLFQDHLSVC